jgi:hypothetical protein
MAKSGTAVLGQIKSLRFLQEHQRPGVKNPLGNLIHEITTIPISALRGASLSQFGVDERLFWIQNRQPTRKEDMVYLLLGIFNVYMPLIYGKDRENAAQRLKEAIRKVSAGEHVNTTPNQAQVGVRQQLSAIDSSIEGLHEKWRVVIRRARGIRCLKLWMDCH